MQRIGVAAELPGLLAGMGVNVVALFAEFGFDPAAFEPDLRLPVARLLPFLTRAVEVSQCEELGVLCGLRFRFDHHGPIGRLMLSAPTLKQALEDNVAWQPAYSSSAVVYLHSRGPATAFGYASYAGSGPGTRTLYEIVLGVGLRMLRELTGRRVGAVEFHLPHRPPKDPAPYARLLGAPVRFNQHESCLILDEALLQTRLPGADPAARRRAQEELRQTTRWGDSDWPTRVRHELRRSLLAAEPSMVRIAEEIGISERTLRRKLDDEGTTFAALRDEVRLTVARALLERTELPIGEIASVLGFASPGIFSEAFQRQTGTAPSKWRRARRGAQD